MRIGLIADVHGNLAALDAVIGAAGKVDHWLCAGDIAGHLPEVDEVAARLREIGAVCVKGNHDSALVEGYGIPGSSAATRALQHQRRHVSRETRDWLAALPEVAELEYEGCKLRLMHGGPLDPLHQRIRMVDDLLRDYARGLTLVVGHSHQVLCEIGQHHAVLNPGPVGLPADGETVARAMVLDLPQRQVKQIAVRYDTSVVERRMESFGHDERYANCLRAGRWIGFTGDAPKLRILVVGASIYGEMIAELVRALPNCELVGFIDDAERLHGESVAGIRVLGPVSALSDIAFEENVTDVAIGIGDNSLRMRVADEVKRQGVRLARLVHPRASVSGTALLEQGVIVDAQAYVGPYCELGEGVSIWPGAVIGHHTRLEAYAAVKPGATIGGHSAIGAAVKIELGSVTPSYSDVAAEVSAAD